MFSPIGTHWKNLSLQVYDNHIYIYYNTELVVEHPISHFEINYKPEHYVETLARGLLSSTNIEELARKNLEANNEVYKNE